MDKKSETNAEDSKKASPVRPRTHWVSSKAAYERSLKQQAHKWLASNYREKSICRTAGTSPNSSSEPESSTIRVKAANIVVG